MKNNGKRRTCAGLAERTNDSSDVDLIGMTVGGATEGNLSGSIVATTNSVSVCPKNRRGSAAIKLQHGFRNWARNRGARSISINVTSGIHMQRTDKLLQRLGFKVSGGNYMLEVG